MKQIKNFVENNKKAIKITAIAVGLFVVLGGASFATLETYHKDRIFNGVFVGPLDLGGMKHHEAKTALERWHDDWWSDQLNYIVYDETGKELKKVGFFPIVVTDGSGQSFEFVYFDLEAMLDHAYRQGRDPSLIKRVVNQVKLLYQPVVFDAVVKVDELTLREVLQLQLAEFETLPENAGIELSSAGGQPIVVSENEGNTFDYEQAITETKRQLAKMKKSVVDIHRARTAAAVATSQVNSALEYLDNFKLLFPVDLNYDDERIDFKRKWTLSWGQAYQALTVEKKDDSSRLALNKQGLDEFFGKIQNQIDVEPLDAKFTIGEDEKVEQFQPSQKGYSFEIEATVAALNDYFYQEKSEESPSPLNITVKVIEPRIATSDVNDLGITEILGVGYSSFSGSPRNRIHNIGIGVAKLDGILIAPDEDFSLLKALKPFTIAAGYLPELVIKGDKIKPEIGGGLCQIGSTTFRAAMKSGLKITQRRNHSLVVNYYNDPRNGLPGTDATIYDPAPDFRFANDTGNYILFKAAMNAQTGDLVFTLWGTSDGRVGEYTKPVVHSWIPAGETKYIESQDLEPGVEKCQGAHPGANASFTYSVTRPDGEVEEKVYSSHYRSLPRICLVGIDPNAPKEGEGESDEISDVIDEVDVSDLPEISEPSLPTGEESSPTEG